MKKEELLKYDAIAEAEKITGEDVRASENAMFLALGLTQLKNQQLERILQAEDDTTFMNDYDEYMGKLQRFGFVKVYEEDFKVTKYSEEKTEKTGALFHYEYSILLIYNTIGTRINSATFYYNVEPKNKDTFWASDVTATGGYRNGVWVGNHDGREAVKHKINGLLREGNFLKQWVEREFIWWVDYQQTEDLKNVQPYSEKSKKFKEITEGRLAKLPEEVRKRILA